MSALEKALSNAKKLKVDECEITSAKKKIITVRITDSEIVEIKQNFDQSFGIRLIHDKKIASLQTTNEEEIEQTMMKALRGSSNLKSREFWEGLPYKTEHVQLEGTFDEKLEQISGSECIGYRTKYD